MSLKETIFEASESLPFEDVPAPELKSKCVEVMRIGTMRSDDYDEWEALVLAIITKSKISGESPLKGQRAALITCTALNPETGERLFAAAEIDKVRRFDGNLQNRLCAAAQRLNPTSTEDQKELEKNSARGRTGAFSSVLRWLPAASMWTDLLRSLRRGKSSSGGPSNESKAIH